MLVVKVILVWSLLATAACYFNYACSKVSNRI
jgi:hypothetical protein